MEENEPTSMREAVDRVVAKYPMWPTYTWYTVDGPLWWRIKMAVALFLSPLTIIFLGRSIRVDAVTDKEEK